MLSTIRKFSSVEANPTYPRLFLLKSRFNATGAFDPEDVASFRYTTEAVVERNQLEFPPFEAVSAFLSQISRIPLIKDNDTNAVVSKIEKRYASLAKEMVAALFNSTTSQPTLTEIKALERAKLAELISELAAQAETDPELRERVATFDIDGSGNFSENRNQDGTLSITPIKFFTEKIREAKINQEEDEKTAEEQAFDPSKDEEDDEEQRAENQDQLDNLFPVSQQKIWQRVAGSTPAQQLLTEGFVIVPLVDALDKIFAGDQFKEVRGSFGKLREKILEELDTFRDPKNSETAIWTWKGVGTPMAFHGQHVRRVRTALVKKMRAVLSNMTFALFSGSKNVWSEVLMGALVNHTGGGGGRGLDRNIFSGIKGKSKPAKTDVVFEGFVNIGQAFEDFVCVPGSHAAGRGERLMVSSVPVARNNSKGFLVPPGSAVIHFSSLVHSQAMQTARPQEDNMRVYAGLRTYSAQKAKTPLQAKIDSLTSNGRVPRHIIGPTYEMYTEDEVERERVDLARRMITEATFTPTVEISDLARTEQVQWPAILVGSTNLAQDLVVSLGKGVDYEEDVLAAHQVLSITRLDAGPSVGITLRIMP